MIINRKNKLPILIIFLSLQLVLYYLTLFVGDVIGNTSSFIIVALSFLFSLLFLDFKNSKFVTQIALFFTVIADIFLVLLTPRTELNQSIAMTSFSIVQLAYLLIILSEQTNKKVNVVNLIIRTSLTILIIIITIIVLKEKINYLAIISMFYYVNLILNVVFSFINVKKSPLLAIGLLAFLLCDTVIGLQVASSSFITITNEFLLSIINANFNLAWLFYAPSQVILAINAENQPSISLSKKSIF